MCASDCHRESELPLPWEGRDDLIMSNKEYWEECAKVMAGEKDVEIPDDTDDEESMEKFTKDYKEYLKVYNEKTDKIFGRRWLGAKKALYEWEQGGCKGERPEDISMLMMIGADAYP